MLHKQKKFYDLKRFPKTFCKFAMFNFYLSESICKFMQSDLYLHKICSDFAGVTGGAGLLIIIITVIVTVGCVIMKRKRTMKLTLSGEGG